MSFVSDTNLSFPKRSQDDDKSPLLPLNLRFKHKKAVICTTIYLQMRFNWAPRDDEENPINLRRVKIWFLISPFKSSQIFKGYSWSFVAHAWSF